MNESMLVSAHCKSCVNTIMSEHASLADHEVINLLRSDRGRARNAANVEVFIVHGQLLKIGKRKLMQPPFCIGPAHDRVFAADAESRVHCN